MHFRIVLSGWQHVRGGSGLSGVIEKGVLIEEEVLEGVMERVMESLEEEVLSDVDLKEKEFHGMVSAVSPIMVTSIKKKLTAFPEQFLSKI